MYSIMFCWNVLLQKEFVCNWYNWYLHLQALVKTTNLFAASGHRNSAKCSRLPLQEIHMLSETNTWLNRQFGDGYHAV